MKNSVQNADNFKNKMAQQVLKAIAKVPKEDEQIPSLLVAASFGGEMDSESGSPNASKGVKDLRRKFEDNEADIITDLYARHFKPQDAVMTTVYGSASQDTPNDKTTEGNVGLAPNDSIGEPHFDSRLFAQGYLLPVDDKVMPQEKKIAGGDNYARNGAPNPDTYSKPLKDKIRYVQYIPKDARGTIEDAVNQLYNQKDVHKKVIEENQEVSQMGTLRSPDRNNFW